ncbi:hypothetical protein CLAIMM_13676 [Cladophialophora immunda]|nr:hypothetical protein CLAIMM_13676 [Cladophialophora immunda]
MFPVEWRGPPYRKGLNGLDPEAGMSKALFAPHLHHNSLSRSYSASGLCLSVEGPPVPIKGLAYLYKATTGSRNGGTSVTQPISFKNSRYTGGGPSDLPMTDQQLST